MKRFMIGNLKTGFVCDSKLKKESKTFAITFDTIPYEVKMIEKPISSILSKEYGGIGSLNLTFILNKDELYTDRVINHVTKKFDITELNLHELRRIVTTVVLYCPDPKDPNLESTESESNLSEEHDVVRVSDDPEG